MQRKGGGEEKKWKRNGIRSKEWKKELIKGFCPPGKDQPRYMKSAFFIFYPLLFKKPGTMNEVPGQKQMAFTGKAHFKLWFLFWRLQLRDIWHFDFVIFNELVFGGVTSPWNKNVKEASQIFILSVSQYPLSLRSMTPCSMLMHYYRLLSVSTPSRHPAFFTFWNINKKYRVLDWSIRKDWCWWVHLWTLLYFSRKIVKVSCLNVNGTVKNGTARHPRAEIRPTGCVR